MITGWRRRSASDTARADVLALIEWLADKGRPVLSFGIPLCSREKPTAIFNRMLLDMLRGEFEDLVQPAIQACDEELVIVIDDVDSVLVANEARFRLPGFSHYFSRWPQEKAGHMTAAWRRRTRYRLGLPRQK